MTPDQWQKVKHIFAEAVELPEAQRAAHVQRACNGDSELLEEVGALLLAASRTGGGAATIDPAAGSHSASDNIAGSIIGPYQLAEPIGEGGFGTVWLADQRSPVVRQVALKILKLGMDTREVIARFEAERQALAMMDHPNIARVFDAGATGTGRPYFVMELVKGIPITDYCDRHQLPIRQRLELLVNVCQAVQHAHQKGIIHRDIKPSNVLVNAPDGEPVPKVIDFGIAKAVSQRLTDKTVFTEVNQMIGTPAYMSPEQARMGALDLDTRCDIYSLGVLMYELLTGVTPFDAHTLRQAEYDEMQRMIREVDPPKPSTRLSALNALPQIAATRRVDPRKLPQLVRGELDWIVMKCLEKDRTRRYETADALRSDITRYLSDQPVLAGPPSRTYRLRKFVRRHRPAVATSVIALLSLIAGIVFYVHSIRAEQLKTARALDEARKQRGEAQKQQQEAKEQTAIAEAVGRFQTNMLASADPQRMFGDKVTVLQAVTAAVRQLDAGKLADQPLVEAAVRDTIGNTLRALGRYDEAEVNLKRALELRRQALPNLHALVAASLNNLARLKKAQGKLTEAEPLFRESLDINKQILPPTDPDLAASMNNLAAVLFALGRASEAEALLRQTLEHCRASLPAGHPDTATTIVNLSAVLQAQGDLKQAEPLLLEALEMMRAARPAGHPDIAFALNNLATLMRDQGKFAEAEPLLREALAISRNVMPTVHPDVALAVNNLAMIQFALGKYSEAETGFREALWVRQQLLSADHPDIVAVLDNLAMALEAQKRYDEAEQTLRTALEIRRNKLGVENPQTQETVVSLVKLLRLQNRADDAERVWSDYGKRNPTTNAASSPTSAP
jgi:serine/threonine protein kinase/tetratricopeptide (TPR) repeat protein